MDYSLQAPLFMEFSRQEFWSGLLFFLLQGIFLTQRSNPGLLHCRQILYCLSHQGSLSSFLSLFYVVVISICIFVGSFSSPSLCYFHFLLLAFCCTSNVVFNSGIIIILRGRDFVFHWKSMLLSHVWLFVTPWLHKYYFVTLNESSNILELVPLSIISCWFLICTSNLNFPIYIFCSFFSQSNATPLWIILTFTFLHKQVFILNKLIL